MNYFDVLLVANAALAVVALYRLGVCTLILTGNNLIVARSLGSIMRYGQPSSQSFVPAYIYSPENLATAAGIMTVSFVTILVFTLLSARRRVRIAPDAPPVPRMLLVLIAIYFVAYMGSSETILSGSYVGGDRVIRYDFELAGGHAFICSFVLYELARRRLLATITARRAFLIMFAIFFLTHYLKGSTGLTTGYLLTSAVMLLPRTGSAQRLRNMLRIGAAMVVIVALSVTFRAIRWDVHEQGWGSSISSVVRHAVESEETREDNSEGVETSANAAQSATHILLCVTLWDSGISRDWRSIYDVVEYTFIPSFFERWFGWQRSLDSRWELADYYPHGGGINVLGEFYWNGGWLCVVVMATALSFFCSLVDKRYRASPFWLMMMVQFAPSFLVGYGYGFAQLARGAINGLLATGVYWGFSRLRLGGARGTDGQVQPRAGHLSVDPVSP